jgi:ABC-type polysaccharide/polyol phosphate export permease
VEAFPFMNSLADLSQSRDLLVNLTLRELRGKYKRSVLGWTWSLVNPIAQVAIFSLVFGVLLKIQIPKGHPSGIHNFPVFLFCGVLPFNFVANGLNGSMLSLLGNAGLIKKVYFRREILIVSAVMSFVVTFGIELAVLMVFVMILGSFVLPWLPMVALLVVILTVYAIGLGLLFSVLNVYFRDMQYLVAIGLQLWFYASPIIYPLTRVPTNKTVGGHTVQVAGHAVTTGGHDIPVRAIYTVINPMVSFVECFRAVLYDRRWPPMNLLGYASVWALVMLWIGVVVFRRYEPRLAEEL